MTFPIQRMTLAVLATLSISACAHEHGAVAAADGAQRATEAVAQLQPTVGSQTQGTIRFVHDGDRIRIQGEVAGLEPNSDHGFHVHEKGDCSAPDATSAGGHFHLPGQKHGDPARDDDHHHAGDLGNIHAGAGERHRWVDGERDRPRSRGGAEQPDSGGARQVNDDVPALPGPQVGQALDVGR